MKKWIIILGVLLVIAVILSVLVLFVFKSKKLSEINSFEDCEAAKQLVVNTHPRECHMKDGRVFIEEGNAFEMQGTIEVTAPEFKAVVDSPFEVDGKAIGSWYYNKQLSMKLEDENGVVLGTGFAKAQETIDPSDNATLVPFIGVITFNNPSSEKGKLIIEKTNPAQKDSDDNDIKAGPLIVPVRFNYQPTPTPTLLPTITPIPAK